MADPQQYTSAQDAYLQSVLQGAPAPSDAAPPPMAAPQQADPNAAPTSVEGVNVVAPINKQGIPYNAPDVMQSAQNLKDAMNNPAMQAQGGGANPGIWGLLPKDMQHGTLRNVIGALGDAFLVAGGGQAQYEPRMERQQEGLAMASYPDHPEISKGLMGATGAPDAVKNVIGLTENENNLALHKDQLAQQSQYHQDRQDSINANNASLDAARKATTANQVNTQIRGFIPQVSGMVNTAKDLPTYTTRYAQADALAKRLDPTTDATKAFGLLPPEMWQPGSGPQGLTSKQEQDASDKAAQRTNSTTNTNIRAGATIGAARIGAGQRSATAAAGMGEQDAAWMKQAADNGVQSLSPTAQARVQYLTTKGNGNSSRPPLTDAAKAAAANGPGGQQQQQYSQVHTYPSGKKAGWNGKQWVPIH